MGRLRSLFKVSAITFLVTQPFYIAPSYAAGFQINEISTSLQGSAMAGAAAADNDVSAMFINPATLSNMQQNQFYLGGSEIFPHVKLKNATAIHTVNIPGAPPTAITAVVPGVNSQASVSKSVFVPDGYFGWRINDNVVAGLAIIAPYGLTTKYYGDSVLRFAAINSALKSINFNPAVAVKFNEKWSFGVGFQAQYLNAVFSNFNGPFTGIPAFDAFTASNYPTYLTASGWGYGFTVGTLFKPDHATRIGLGYRSVVSNQISGSGQQYVSPGGVVPGPSPDFPFNAQTSASAGVKTPPILTLSGARDIRDWTIKATIQMNFWSSFNHLSINMPNAYATNSTISTKWSDAWFLALGADYRLNTAWVLRAGLAFDQTPTNDATRDARIPDGDRYWTNIGASYIFNKHFSLDGAYSHLFSPNQTVNVTQASGSNAITTVPLEVNQVTAKYNSSVDIVALALRYSF